MTNDRITFDAAAESTLECTVDGTTYEFQQEHVPSLKAMFESLEIDGADVPDFEGSTENFRERVSDE